jgi:pimeloyl-ACP methyl ester carboxylesterase
MTAFSDADIQAVLDAISIPRRRARPRTARTLLDADHAMIEAPVGRIAAWRRGPPGPAHLLVHGWEDDSSLWDQMIEALEPLHAAVIAFDLPAHGFSEGRSARLPDAAVAVAAVAAALGPIDGLITHSYGGPAAITAMEDHGLSPRRVVLIAPPLAQAERWDWMAERFGMAPALLAAARARYEAEIGRSLDWFDLRRAARAMTIPALFVHSADDEMCRHTASLELEDNWPGSRAWILDGLGHRDIARDAGVCAEIADFVGASH